MFCRITKFFRWCANAAKTVWKLSRVGNPEIFYGFLSSLYNRNYKARQSRFRAFDNLITRVDNEYETNISGVEFPPYGKMYKEVVDLSKENEKIISAMREHHAEGTHIPCAKGPSLKLIQLSFGSIPTNILEYKDDCNIKLIDESGPTLSFSQSPTGHVSIFVYYAYSDYITPPEEGREKPIVYMLQRDPDKIDTKTIRRAIRFLLCVANISSCFGTNTIWQHLYLWWRKVPLFFQTSNRKQMLESLKFIIEHVPHP